jgi:hypothetical protein
MGVLKQLDKAGSAVTLAFCPPLGNGPEPTLLAAGTVAGAVDVNFSATSQLEVRACSRRQLAISSLACCVTTATSMCSWQR